MPLVQISYSAKAPTCASIDDIEGKLRDHYGKIYTDAALYQKEVLDDEKKVGWFGDKLATIETKAGKTFDLHKVCTNCEGFSER